MAFADIPNDLFVRVPQESLAGGRGSLASIYKPASKGFVNVTDNYPWTTSPQSIRRNAPRIVLKEYEINEDTMKRQALFYLTGLQDFAEEFPSGPSAPNDILEVYEELYPRDRPTGFVYDFPYFDEVNFQVTTDQWASLDTLEQLAGAVTGGIADLGVTDQQNFIGQGINAIRSVGGLLAGSAAAAPGFLYPKVGITDRPRLWQTHKYRTIEVVCPLYNTIHPDAWWKNRALCELLVNQNLYNKRDIITGIPPVYYEVMVLGQHYSWASCVTNLTIYNRGNMRMMEYPPRGADNATPGNFREINVPDVYEIRMTLTDLVVPSKNQFQSLNTLKVYSELRATST